MSRHSTKAKSRTASCEYKSVGEAGNARQGIRSASSDGKTMISMATHDTRSESDGRSAFGSPGAEAAPASDSTGGGPITLNVFPNRAAGPCAGLFYVVMRLDGAPSTGNGQIPAGQRADRGVLGDYEPGRSSTAGGAPAVLSFAYSTQVTDKYRPDADRYHCLCHWELPT